MFCIRNYNTIIIVQNSLKWSESDNLHGTVLFMYGDPKCYTHKHNLYITQLNGHIIYDYEILFHAAYFHYNIV